MMKIGNIELENHLIMAPWLESQTCISLTVKAMARTCPYRDGKRHGLTLNQEKDHELSRNDLMKDLLQHRYSGLTPL
jgi:hypothetical protein